jgi:xylulokinase
VNNLIAYDLGTGGLKASIINDEGRFLGESFFAYETGYPHENWCEQRPMDWWNAVCRATRELLEKSGLRPGEIAGAALSGHSLVTAPMDRAGNLLTESVPIWCDMRAGDMTGEFFEHLSYRDWYSATGNGDPPECYSIMKLMWMRRHLPDIYKRTGTVLGSKDFINYMLTGAMCTDPSYASGFGVFNLKKWNYEDDFFKAAGVNPAIFPDMAPSDAVVGRVTGTAAAQTGLPKGLPVICGGVDNMCMALGAVGLGEGKAYTSLGSSAWIALNSREPILDVKTRPFVFAHAQKGLYTSGVSIFSAGNSYRWARDNLLANMPFAEMDALAAGVPAGSGGVMFSPALAGGSAQEPSPNMRGAFIGLSLGTTQAQLIRAVMEGVALALKGTLDILKLHTGLDKAMLICGGGSKSGLWRQIFADVYDMDIIKTNVDQGAATLGAAALAANGVGLWKGYDMIPAFHRVEGRERPVRENAEKYRALSKVFQKLAVFTAQIGDETRGL